MAALSLSIHSPSRTASLFCLAPRAIHPYLPLSRPSWSIPCEASSSSNTFNSNISLERSQTPLPWYTTLIPSLNSLLELFPPILLAAPKKKTSHSRKSMRSANKGLQNKTNFTNCPACGQVKLAHNICPNCYSQISRRWKAEGRGERQVYKSPVDPREPNVAVEGEGSKGVEAVSGGPLTIGSPVSQNQAPS